MAIAPVQTRGEQEPDPGSVFDCIPGYVAIVSPEGLLQFANRQMTEYFGAPLSEADRRCLTFWIHPDDLGPATELFDNSLRSGEPYDHEQRMRRSDGSFHWFHVRAAPLREPSGQILRWHFLLTDIDSRRRAEEDLTRAYRDLEEAQRLSRTGSYANDYAARHHTWSDELYRMFEFEPGSIVTSEAALAAVHPDDRAYFAAAFEKSACDGTDVDLNYRIVTASGKIKYLHTVAHISGWQDKQPIIIGAVQDITDTRLAEMALDKARAELAHASRAMSLGVLAASIAHEVNQPLSGIITNASTCLRLLSAVPPDLEGARETARRTIRDGKRAAEVISRLRLLFAKKGFSPESMDLNEAVREVVALSAHEMQRDRIDLRLRAAEGLPPVVGDRIQIQQVVINLILNATDAMRHVDASSRRLTIETLLDSGTAGQDCVRVAVSDTGTGIAADALGRIFDPFFTTKDDGLGIGLSISRTIIERHGGKLWGTSSEDKGSTFEFCIPCDAAGARAS